MATKEQVLELLQKTPNQITLKLLRDMAETVIWMSGSSSFGPEGEAFKGWLKARKKLNRTLKFLERYKDGH
jgi:hypothetical protein